MYSLKEKHIFSHRLTFVISYVLHQEALPYLKQSLSTFLSIDRKIIIVFSDNFCTYSGFAIYFRYHNFRHSLIFSLKKGKV